MNDSRDFRDAESVRSGQSHVTSQPAFFTPFQNPGGMLSRSLGMPSRNDGPPSVWDTHGKSGNVFANPRRFHQHLIRKSQILWWPGGWGPQGLPKTGGGGLARVPKPACVQTPKDSGWHTQGRKDELTSCRGTVQSAWQKPPVRRKGGRAGLPKKGKWPPRVTGTDRLHLSWKCAQGNRQG